MASLYETLDVGQLIQIGVVEEHEEAVPTCSTTNEDHFMRWTDECVKLLIALYQVHEPKFANVNFKNKSVWDTIATEMKKRVTTQQLYNVPTSGSSLKKVLSRLKTTKERQEGGIKPASFITNLATSLASNQELTGVDGVEFGSR